jgi:hypothetical protein
MSAFSGSAILASASNPKEKSVAIPFAGWKSIRLQPHNGYAGEARSDR